MNRAETTEAMKGAAAAARVRANEATGNHSHITSEWANACMSISKGEQPRWDHETSGRNAGDAHSLYYRNNLIDWKNKAKAGKFGFDTLDPVIISHFARTDKKAPLKVSEFAKDLASAVSQSKITKVSLSQDIGSPNNRIGTGFTDEEMDNLIKSLPSTVKSISIDGRFSEKNLNTLLDWMEKNPGVDLSIDTSMLKGAEENEGKISAKTFNRLVKACESPNRQIASLNIIPNEDPLIGDKLLSPPVGHLEGYGHQGNVIDTSVRLGKLGNAFGLKGALAVNDRGNYTFIPQELIDRIRNEGRNIASR